jgi:hypothetical protein
MPNDVHSKNVMARVLLLLSELRHLPNFIMIPIRVFAQLKPLVKWPNPSARSQLANISCVFGELDDALIASIQEHLRKILEENAPGDTLKKHLVATFGATCTDVDRIAEASGNEPAILAILALIRVEGNDIMEDFVITGGKAANVKDVEDAIRSFYAARGFAVDSFAGEMFAEKDGHLRSVGYGLRPDGVAVTFLGR